MINGVEVSVTPVDFEIAKNRKTYWVTMKRTIKYRGIEKEKKIDVGYLTFKKDEPDINQVFIHIGDDIRFSDTGTYRWIGFFKKDELEFLEKLAENVMWLGVSMEEISSGRNKINKKENELNGKDTRDMQILNMLKNILV